MRFSDWAEKRQLRKFPSNQKIRILVSSRLTAPGSPRMLNTLPCFYRESNAFLGLPRMSPRFFPQASDVVVSLSSSVTSFGYKVPRALRDIKLRQLPRLVLVVIKIQEKYMYIPFYVISDIQF